MKVLADKTGIENDVNTDGAIGKRGTLMEDDEAVGLYSSNYESEERAECHENKFQERLKHEREEEENEENYGRRKSKKKHKKRHHKHHGSRIRKDPKKQKKQVDPILLWSKNRQDKIVKVVCENYLSRIKLVRTSAGDWSTSYKVSAVAQPKSSVYESEDDSSKYTLDELNIASMTEREDGPADKLVVEVEDEPVNEPTVEPVDVDKPEKQTENKLEVKSKKSEQIFVDLIDNSTDFVDTICSDEDEVEQRAIIHQALETIDQDPALLDDVKIELPNIGTANLKLPEGTTIHQVKAEDTMKRSIPLIPVKPPIKCTFGELTITPQQHQQNEPLNLETVGKRSALEIRLQEPPLKKKRIIQPPQHQLPIEPYKHEWDPLSELKEVLSDPRLSVPDPLLVPRCRLAYLVASPATEIPKLLEKAPSCLLPPPDPDLLAVSLSNIDQMLLSLLQTPKDMNVGDVDPITNMLNMMFNNPTVQQSFNYSQQTSQWGQFFYNGSLASPYSSTPSYSKPDDCGTLGTPIPSLSQQLQMPPLPPQVHQESSLLGLQSQQESTLLSKIHHQSQTPLLPIQPTKDICQKACCNGSPSSCYKSCCPKTSGCNPFTMNHNSCNPFPLPLPSCSPYIVSSNVCEGNINTCGTTYPTDGTTCCYSSEVGCEYNGQPLPPMPINPAASPCNLIQCNYQTSSGQPQQTLLEKDPSFRSVENIDKDSQVTPPISPPVAPLASDVGETTPPLKKPKIKVKEHLIDPNARQQFLNIEGALHLARANSKEFENLSMWNPFFGR